MHTAFRRFLTIFATLALLALSAVVLSACNTAQTATDSWLQPNQNSSNTRYAGGRISTTTVGSLGVGWVVAQKSDIGAGLTAPSPFIDESNAFVQNNGDLVAFDLETGKASSAKAGVKSVRMLVGLGAIERSHLQKFSPDIAPIVTSDGDKARIVVGADGNRVSALSVSEAKTAWERKIDREKDTHPAVTANMAVAGDTVYVPVADVSESSAELGANALAEKLAGGEQSGGRLVALNSDNGNVRWTKKLDSAPLGAATAVNDVVFTATVGGRLYAFNAGSGKQLFESPLPAGVAAPLAASGATVIVPAGVALEKGQKASVVAFTIGGLGVIDDATVDAAKGAGKPAAEDKTEEKEAAEAPKIDGETLFTENCAGCHKLDAAGANGAAGPDLDALKLTVDEVDKQVTEGGAAMPAFKDSLSAEEIKALSEYVVSVAGK